MDEKNNTFNISWSLLFEDTGDSESDSSNINFLKLNMELELDDAMSCCSCDSIDDDELEEDYEDDDEDHGRDSYTNGINDDFGGSCCDDEDEGVVNQIMNKLSATTSKMVDHQAAAIMTTKVNDQNDSQRNEDRLFWESCLES